MSDTSNIQTTELQSTELQPPDWVPQTVDRALAALTHDQQRAAMMISCGRTATEIYAAGISRASLNRYRKIPEFRIALAALNRETWETTRQKVLAAGTDAIEYLHQVVVNEDLLTRDRVKAAEAILKLSGDRRMRPLITTDLVEVESQIIQEN